MKAERIRSLLHAAPFEPFEIHMTDSKSYVVEHPDFAMFSTDYKTLHLAMDPDEDNDFQFRVILDVRHITQITENTPRRPRRSRKKAG